MNVMSSIGTMSKVPVKINFVVLSICAITINQDVMLRLDILGYQNFAVSLLITTLVIRHVVICIDVKNGIY
jgi:hypothetical protein